MTMHGDRVEPDRDLDVPPAPDIEWTIARKPDGGERIILWERDNQEAYITTDPDTAIDMGAL